MISRIDHIALAVRDYEKARRFFQAVFGAVEGTHGGDPAMKYFWQLFSLGDLSRFELVTPTENGSFLDGFLSRREGGVHHITMQTPDIEGAKRNLEQHQIPYFGFNAYGEVWKELFIHPRDAFGVLIQIAQFRPDDWLPDTVKHGGEERVSVIPEKDGCILRCAHPGGGTVSLKLDRDEMKKLASALK